MKREFVTLLNISMKTSAKSCEELASFLRNPVNSSAENPADNLSRSRGNAAERRLKIAVRLNREMRVNFMENRIVTHDVVFSQTAATRSWGRPLDFTESAA